MLHCALPPSHSSSTMFKIAHRVIWWLQIGEMHRWAAAITPVNGIYLALGSPGAVSSDLGHLDDKIKNY